MDSHLARWRRQGRIERVKEGVYVRVDGGSERVAGGPFDVFAVASRLAPDAVLAYHTAMELHGFAQSVFERLVFATWTKTRRVSFAGREFVPVRPRAALLRSGTPNRWTEVVERSGVEVRITTLERTAVDIVDRLDLAGGPDEVWRSWAQIPALDLREVESYVRTVGRRGLAAKIGYLLDRQREELVVPQALLDRLRDHAPRTPVYVERGRRGRLIPPWNLVVPETWVAHPHQEPA
jgi:predicted transcriptional regulator of viral defense system